MLTPAQLAAVERVYGDIADTDFIVKTVEKIQPTFIIHLGTDQMLPVLRIFVGYVMHCGPRV